MKEQALVYSCSGCSSVAQLANEIALRLDRHGDAEMSCIAGVGGDVPLLVRLAKSGRRIVAIDGCPLACAKSCLARHGVVSDRHYILSEYGAKKHLHCDPDEAEIDRLYEMIRTDAGINPVGETN